VQQPGRFSYLIFCLYTHVLQELDLVGLEDNADFWDMGIDDAGEEIIPIRDLTKQLGSPDIGCAIP
jgi:hypothetical protein